MRSSVLSMLVLGFAACGDDKAGTTDTTATDDDADAVATTDTTVTADSLTGTDTGPGDDATTTTDAVVNTDASDLDIATATDTAGDPDAVVPECDGPEDCQAVGIVPVNRCQVPACIEGHCGLGPPDCADADPCTFDGCQPATGECTHETHTLIAGISQFQLCPEPLSQAGAATACFDAGGELASFDTIEVADQVTAEILSSGLVSPWVHSFLGVTCSSGKAKIIPQQCRLWADTGAGSCATIATCDELHPFVCEKSCDDGDPCTTDVIDEAGACSHGTTDCNDHDVCTDDRCEAGVGCVNEVPLAKCADSDPCTTDTCVPADGSCTHKPVRVAWSGAQYEALECPGTASWADARQRCALDGGILAMPTTDPQKAVMQALASRPGATSSMWVPLDQPGGDPNPWTWVDAGGSGDPPWCSGEPDDAGGQDCAEWSTLSVCLYDGVCSEARSFACVIDVTIP
ncbi:MAG: C-type lectin domain-containing protein [Myxococcota bacterium]